MTLLLYSSSMDSVSSLLPKVLRKRGIKDEADASLVTFAANQWMKEHAILAEAKKLNGGVLFIEVASSIAAQECHGKTVDLLEEMQKQFPGIGVENVRILRS